MVMARLSIDAMTGNAISHTCNPCKRRLYSKN
jgi:hypothetical protein